MTKYERRHGKCFPRKSVIPQLSPADEDLLLLKWVRDRHGYPRRVFSVNGNRKLRPIHRIVMERMVGRSLESKELVDHINGNSLDARRENLRLVDSCGNQQNRKSNPFRGASRLSCGKWQARVKYRRKALYLGVFKDRQEAARVAAAKRLELGFMDRPSTPNTEIIP